MMLGTRFSKQVFGTAAVAAGVLALVPAQAATASAGRDSVRITMTTGGWGPHALGPVSSGPPPADTGGACGTCTK
jgi:hypothetical protein